MRWIIWISWKVLFRIRYSELFLSTSTIIIKYWLITHQFRYISTKFKTELHWKLKVDTISNCEHLRKIHGITKRRIIKDKSG